MLAGQEEAGRTPRAEAENLTNNEGKEESGKAKEGERREKEKQKGSKKRSGSVIVVRILGQYTKEKCTVTH